MYLQKYLEKNGVSISIRELLFNQKEYKVKIPTKFILQERVSVNCSLTEADIIQEVMFAVFGEEKVEKGLETVFTKTTNEFKLYVFKVDN